MRFLKTNNKNWIKLCKKEIKAKQLEINIKEKDYRSNFVNNKLVQGIEVKE